MPERSGRYVNLTSGSHLKPKASEINAPRVEPICLHWHRHAFSVTAAEYAHHVRRVGLRRVGLVFLCRNLAAVATVGVFGR